MKTIQQKKEDLKQITSQLVDAKMTVFTAYAPEGEKGLPVAKIRDLKKGLKSVNAEYTATKKTIIDKALKEHKVTDVDVFGFSGSLGVAFAHGDETQTAKAIYGFSRFNPSLKLFGALLGDRYITSKQFIELAKLPAREVLLGRAVGMIQYPLTGLVGALSGNIRKLVLTLSAVQQQKQ